MKIAIIGYGIQGKSSYDYWHDGNEITICDAHEELELPEGASSQLGPNYLKDLDRFDLIVRTSSMHPDEIIAANSEAITSKVTTNTNEFFRVCPSKNVIGVTGTKGKGTTSTLITQMLRALGHTTHLGGNIGIPPLDLLKENIAVDDYVVLELASYQLIDIRYSPHIAVCLMIAPEHQDWHKDLAEYYKSKAELFAHQTANDIAIYFADNQDSKSIAAPGLGQKLPYYAKPGAIVQNEQIVIDDKVICAVNDIKLLGRHNLQNICAALTAVWQINQDVEILRQVITHFQGLPFRIEFRRSVNDISYYNDSYASAPPATLAALATIPGNKVLIVGGFDRNLDLNELVAGIAEKQDEITGVVIIGASSQRLGDCFENYGLNNFQVTEAKDMPTIVTEATALAQPGDSVVLSPGFPSFDMFANFEDRGRKFNEAVEAL